MSRRATDRWPPVGPYYDARNGEWRANMADEMIIGPFASEREAREAYDREWKHAALRWQAQQQSKGV